MKRKVNLGKQVYYPQASKKCWRNNLILNLLSKSMKSNSTQELIHVSLNVSCTFNLTLFWSNTLRKGLVDSFLKPGTPVLFFTSPADPDSN